MFIPLQECLRQEVGRVGFRSQGLARAQSQVAMPFALVLTSESFEEFFKAAGLESLMKESTQARTTDMQIKVFATIQDAIQKAVFPQKVLEHLRECYELIVLDTEKLGTQPEHCILSLQRSTSYEDQDYTTPTFAFSTNQFDRFVAMIKQVYLSCFTPASIVDRLREGIQEFSCAIIISRLPQFHTILETNLSDTDFKVNSYVGFIDPGKVVYRDGFDLAREFLKIENRSIIDQRVASIFDLQRNAIIYKEYAKGTGQTAPDNIILEAGRLTKRAKELTSGIATQGVFISDGEHIHCLTIRSQTNSVDHAKGVARQQLAQELKRYLTTHKYPEFKDQIDGSLKRLDSGNKEDLKDALQLALTITQFEQ